MGMPQPMTSPQGQGLQRGLEGQSNAGCGAQGVRARSLPEWAVGLGSLCRLIPPLPTACAAGGSQAAGDEAPVLFGGYPSEAGLLP